MEDTIFTRIIKGEMPSHKVYEDERSMAIMDIHPTQPGQVVVFSKAQVDHFMDLDPEDYHALMAAVKKVSIKMHELFPDARIGVQIEGFDVPHAHVKIFPIHSPADFHAQADENGPDQTTLTQMAEKLSI